MFILFRLCCTKSAHSLAKLSEICFCGSNFNQFKLRFKPPLAETGEHSLLTPDHKIGRTNCTENHITNVRSRW